MFENYREMSADEKAQVKAIHQALRKECWSRAGNLAWGFVRGFPYRRIERKTRTQVLGDGTTIAHNPPPLHAIAKILQKHLPGVKFMENSYTLAKDNPLEAWVKNQEGAIQAPSPRERKPFNKEVA